MKNKRKIQVIAVSLSDGIFFYNFKNFICYFLYFVFCVFISFTPLQINLLVIALCALIFSKLKLTDDNRATLSCCSKNNKNNFLLLIQIKFNRCAARTAGDIVDGVNFRWLQRTYVHDTFSA